VEELRTLDAVAAAVLALAALRGVWIGAVREAFSLAGLAAAVLVVRAWREPAAGWLDAHGPFEMTGLAAEILAALALGAAALLAVAVAGRMVRRGVRGAGLGLLDRLAGLLLGATEGALVVAARGARGDGNRARRRGARRLYGSTQRPRSRMSATRRPGASASRTLRTRHSCPTYRFTRPTPEPT
jgi:hypothetical protein